LKFDANRTFTGQRQQRLMANVKMVRCVHQLLFEKRLEWSAGQESGAVIDVLIAARPETDNFFELGGGQARRALSLEDDLIIPFGWRRRGNPRVGGQARVRDVV